MIYNASNDTSNAGIALSGKLLAIFLLVATALLASNAASAPAGQLKWRPKPEQYHVGANRHTEHV